MFGRINTSICINNADAVYRKSSFELYKYITFNFTKMSISKQQYTNARDYSAISPSAKALLLLKGITNIPFAKEAAELISLPAQYIADTDNTDIAFWKRVVHFENRYWNIEQLLSPLSIHNILELSSGFSFRGLEMVKQEAVHYIDTDLPELIQQKKNMVETLQGSNAPVRGLLETLPLDALDEEQFSEIVAHFPPGPVAVINEGLLMYLGNREKERICAIIHRILKQRGGYWITGDIYVKSTLERFSQNKYDSLKDLVEQQRIEDNMFESFEAAEAFFKKAGFVIDKEAEIDFTRLTSLQYLVANSTEAQLAAMQQHQKIQTSWRLKVSD